jgi:serine/threonine protein kinase/tetratricopeptide (TPR) repeat protein
MEQNCGYLAKRSVMLHSNLTTLIEPPNQRKEPVALASGTLLGHYEIRSKLGEGGMGEVYLAHDTKLGRNVALKLLPEELTHDRYRLQRFVQEAQAASAINHPNVCVIHEVGESADGRPFIAMEYVEGETLSAKIHGRPLSQIEIVDIGSQVADALSEAHAKGIIHRDIKPSNIAVTPRGQAKVLDFGLARIVAMGGQIATSDLSTQAKTESGILLGTVDYMSPEQALGREVDARSDIFSLGVVLFEMATGRRPFSSKNPLETIDRIAHAEPESIPSLNPKISSSLQGIISKCLEKDPKQRYQSAKELMQELAALKQEVRPVPYHRRLTLALAGLIVLLVLFSIPTVRQVISGLFVDLPSEKYLAVLPFHVVGDDAVSKSIADGLVQTLTTQLSALEQFHETLIVVPAADVRERGVTSPSQARAAFGVSLAITGSVQREGDRVRLTLNLNDAKTLRQLRSSVNDHLRTGLSLQDDVIVKLVQMMNVELRPKIQQVLAAGRTDVPGAYDFYLQGLGYLERYDKVENLDLAAERFNQALQKDPKYTLAYAKLGELYWRKYKATRDTQWIEPAIDKSQKAVQLNDQLPSVHVTLGLIYTGRGQRDRALAEFQQALDLDPDNDEAHRGLAGAYEESGNIKQAEEAYLKAIALKPGYWAGYARLARFYFFQRRYEDAIFYYSRVVELTPDSAGAYYNRGAAYLASERTEEARMDFERSLKIQPSYGAYSNLGSLYFYEEKYSEAAATYAKAKELSAKDYRLWGNLASAYFWTSGEDRKSEARAAYKQAALLAEEILKVNPLDATVLTNLAQYYAMLDQRNKALALLNRALNLTPADNKLMFRAAEIHGQLGNRQLALKFVAKALERGYSKAGIERSPNLRRLRTDPGFQSLLQTPQHHLKR